MEEKLLLSNETKITESNFKTMMIYKKFYQDLPIIVLKITICISIIILCIILDIDVLEKVIYMFMSILGIIDTFKIKEEKAKDLKLLKYEFFEDYFLVNNQKIIFEIEYKEINNVIEAKNYYYFIIDKIPMVIAKDGFIYGNNEELKKLINRKRSSKYEKNRNY